MLSDVVLMFHVLHLQVLDMAREEVGAQRLGLGIVLFHCIFLTALNNVYVFIVNLEIPGM